MRERKSQRIDSHRGRRLRDFMPWAKPTGAGTAVIRAALGAAYSSASDDDATLRLSNETAPDPTAIREAQRFFESRRDEFINDRAYRLLVALARGDGWVPAISEANRERFDSEAHLGRLPLRDAFALLADRKPELRSLASSAATCPTPSDILLDPAGHPDSLCESNLAVSIATQFLAIQRGQHEGDPATSYFALPKKTVVLTTRFRTSE